jgi:hypothetical protein
MSESDQGAYQTPTGERELRVYENLDLVLTQLGEPYREHLWHIVWKLTGSDPAVFSAARRWLKVHDPAKERSSEVAIVEVASTQKDAEEGEQ